MLEPIIDDEGSGKIEGLGLRRANGGKLGRLERLFMDFDELDALDDIELVGAMRRSRRELAFNEVRVPFERLPETEWWVGGLW